MDAAGHDPNSAPSTRTSKPDGLPALYQHAVKTEWGLAILAWERDGKRGYQFEDGKLRIFKDGYFDKLVEVDRSLAETEDVVADLSRQLGRTENRLERKEAGVSGKPLLSFEDQLSIFSSLFPQGFDDPKWISDVRGEDASRRLKRHRQPAISDAQTKLDAETMTRLVTSEDYDTICDLLSEVFAGTDLVATKRAKAIAKLKDTDKRLVSTHAYELLYGEDHFEVRFSRWVRILRSVFGKTSWQLATVLPALSEPAKHVCVRPSSFREQAAWMAPRLKMASRPDARLYMRLVEMADTVRQKLEDNSLVPRDLMDVYDFMWTTLRPAARKVLDDSEADGEGSADEEE